MLSLTQQQKLQQRLSPQQIQYIKLLQLPQLALEQAIKAELEANPALEEGVDGDLEGTSAEPQTADQELSKPVEEEKKNDDDDFTYDDLSSVTSSKDDEFSWEDFMNEDDLYGRNSEEAQYNGHNDDDRPDFTPVYVSNQMEKIREQINWLDFSEKQIQIAEELLGSAGADGYLRIENSRILDDLYFNSGITATEDEIESVRQEIMSLDPVGILSRNLQECLLVQLKNMEFSFEVEDAILILTECYEEFTKKHFDVIMKKLDLDEEQVREAFRMIQRLNPKPGEGDFAPNENYITPDFFVQNDNGELQIFLNDKGLPPLRINKQYVAMASSKTEKVDEETRLFIKKKVEDAKFFRQSIMQRRLTMQKVMTAITDIQHQFFLTGTGLRPMILKDIAEKILMDISTVSRVVNSKYVQTEYGVFSLRHFFSEAIETDSGEDASSKEVKEKLRKIIESENGKKPYSDDKLSELLQKEGFTIARRTITKYREALNIPIARLRKTI